jgi:hypothetical protein
MAGWGGGAALDWSLDALLELLPWSLRPLVFLLELLRVALLALRWLLPVRLGRVDLSAVGIRPAGRCCVRTG